MKKVVISIGSFRAKDVEEYLSKGFEVVAYEPRKDIYEKYLKINRENFFPYNFAVVADESVKSIILKIIKGRKLKEGFEESDWYVGSSTYCGEEANFEDSWQFEGIVDKYPVKAVSIHSVLAEYKKIEELHFNCEGEEIPIILKTPIELFLKCKTIVVDFHWAHPHLNIPKEEGLKCLDKLSEYFEATIVKSNPIYKFERKELE